MKKDIKILFVCHGSKNLIIAERDGVGHIAANRGSSTKYRLPFTTIGPSKTKSMYECADDSMNLTTTGAPKPCVSADTANL